MAKTFPRLTVVALAVAGLSAPTLAFAAEIIDDRVTQTIDLPTWELRQNRKKMQAGQYLTFIEMRDLADAGDGLAAFRYGNRLVALEDPALLDDAAMYYASAVFTGREYAVGPMIKILERPDFDAGDKRLTHIENAMRTMSIQGIEKASDALSTFYEQGHPFGRHPERVRTLLLERAEAGDGEAAIRLASEVMVNDGSTDVSEDRLRQVLTMASQNAETLGSRAVANSLLTQLDQSDSQSGKETQ